MKSFSDVTKSTLYFLNLNVASYEAKCCQVGFIAIKERDENSIYFQEKIIVVSYLQ